MDKKILRVAFMDERSLSFFIDCTIISFLISLSFGLFTLFNVSFNWISYIIGLLLLLIKDTWNGQSIGKRILKIAVRDATDPRKIPNKVHLILRNITMLLCFFDAFYRYLNKTKQTFSEKLTNTVDVKLTTDSNLNEAEVIERYQEDFKEGKSNKKPIFQFIIIGILLLIFMYGMSSLITLSMKNDGAYKEAIYQIQRNEEIIKETGGIESFGSSPYGSISINNGSGYAELIIKVEGTKKDIEVYTVLSKEAGKEWRMDSLEISN